MAFELVVAAKRDPVETAEALKREPPAPKAVPLPVATIDVNGTFCEQSASELVASIEQALHQPADTVIVRFGSVACGDDRSLVKFVRWVERLRRNGHDVRVAAGEPHVHALLAEHATSSDAVIHPAQADAVSGRRVVDVRR